MIIDLGEHPSIAHLPEEQKQKFWRAILTPPRTNFQLQKWMWKVFGLWIADTAVCKEHDAPLAAVADAFFARSERSVWKGSRGLGGKCLYAHDLLPLATGEWVEAAELARRGTEVLLAPGYGTPKPVAARFEDNGVQPVVALHLDSGILIRRTLNHPVMTGRLHRERGCVKVPDSSFTQAGSINKGDLVLVPDRLPVIDPGSVYTDDEVRFVGYLLGDGNTRHHFGFTAGSPEMRAEIERIAGGLGLVTRYDSEIDLLFGAGEGKRYKGPLRQPGRNRGYDVAEFAGVFGKASWEKQIPAWAFRLPDSQVGVLLNAILATDGHLSTRKGKTGYLETVIELGVTSKELRDGFSRLCHRLGIRGTHRERPGRYRAQNGVMVECRRVYIWRCARESIIPLLDACGPIFGKEAACQRLRDCLSARSYEHRWRRDGAPEGYHWEKVVRVEHVGEQPTVSVEVPDTHLFCGPAVEHNTVLLAALSLAEAILLKANVSLLGGSGEQSRRVHAYMSGEEMRGKFWQGPFAPRHLLSRDPQQYKTRLRGGGAVTALLASTRSVRGPHPQRMRGDEIDEMNRKIWDAAAGQPMTAEGIRSHILGSSTHHYAKGTMTEELEMAAERGWRVFTWCYRENLRTPPCTCGTFIMQGRCEHSTNPRGWLSPEEVRIKRAQVTKVMWDTEYELQEPSVEGRAIMVEAVNWTFDPGFGRYPGVLGDKLIIEQPVYGGKYCAGADWGKKRDKSIFTIWRYDLWPMRLVAFYHLARQPYPQMIAAYDQLVGLYNAAAAFDGTGIGTVIEDFSSAIAEPVSLQGKTRSDIFDAYIVAMENQEMKAPRIEYMYTEHKWATVGDLYTKSGHPPDSFISGALAWWAKDNATRRLLV